MTRLCATLVAVMLALCSQASAERWEGYELTGLENWYASHKVCGLPISNDDRAIIIAAYAKANAFSIEDAKRALDAKQALPEASNFFCMMARNARLRALREAGKIE